MIRVVVNGDAHDVPPETTVAGLIERLGLVPAQVAVERNGELVRRAAHASTTLAGDDVIEIVTLVGGG